DGHVTGVQTCALPILLGTDVVWSLSPVLHNRAFEARGLDAVYVPLQAESLEAFLTALPAFALSGFSVTRPFKVDIVPHLQEVDEIGRASCRGRACTGW